MSDNETIMQLQAQVAELTGVVERLKLKNQALLEKMGKMTSDHEDQFADLRVDYTMLAKELQRQQESQLQVSDEAYTPEVNEQ